MHFCAIVCTWARSCPCSSPVYSYREVDRLLGLNPDTAKRWINGYRRNGREYDPIVREESTDAKSVTWGEFIETRLLSEYRDVNEIKII